MKAVLFSALLIGGAAVADEKMTTPGTPMEVCNKLVEAAKTDNFESVMSLSAGPKMGKKGPKKFKKMQGDYMEKIKGITCGTEHIAGERAFVEAAAGTEKRFIPFVSQNGEWKFDMGTYKAFYREHGKKGPKAAM